MAQLQRRQPEVALAQSYYEDTDLAFKVREARHKVVYQPASVVVHHEGVSHGTDTGSGIKAQQAENQKKFRERWRSELERFHFPNSQALNPFRLMKAFPIDPGKISLSGTKIIMESPRVNGFTTDSRPYELTARDAAQDLTRPDVLELKEVYARVELKDGQHVTVKSIKGAYNTRGDILKLNDHITVNSTSGYEGHLSEATINVASGSLVSEVPVEIRLPNDGLLNAHRMRVEKNGTLIVFSGGVEMTINPDQLRSATQEGPPSTVPTQVSIPHPPADPDPPVLAGRHLHKIRRSGRTRQQKAM